VRGIRLAENTGETNAVSPSILPMRVSENEDKGGRRAMLMRVLRNLLTASSLVCVIVVGAQAPAFGQRKGDEKKDPPKQEKVIPKEDKQPKGNDQQRNNNPPPKNDNRKPPF
jgi:hypothetical protein